MRQFIGAVLVTALVSGLSSPARAGDEKEVKAILDKAIKALGGEAKLGMGKVVTVKAKGKFNFGGMESNFTTHLTVQGLDQSRAEFEGDFGGNPIKGVTVVNGEKGWRRFGDFAMDLDKDSLTNEKRSVYLQTIPATLLPLKGSDFKVETAGEEKVGDKPAVALKVIGPEGKDFKLYFNKETGLPVAVSAKVIGFMGEEFTQEITLDSYKDFGGIKKATKVEVKRDGEKFMEQEITEFKILEKVDPKTFDEPQS